MLQRLANLKLLTIAAVALFFTTFMVGVPTRVAAAPGTSSKTAVCEGIARVDSSQGCSTGGVGVERLIKGIVKILSYAVGVVAIIMIIVAGFKYITSSGDTGKVASAKNTLIYAIIGVVVAVLAQPLVNLAFNVANGSRPCQYDSSITASDPKCVKP